MGRCTGTDRCRHGGIGDHIQHSGCELETVVVADEHHITQLGAPPQLSHQLCAGEAAAQHNDCSASRGAGRLILRAIIFAPVTPSRQ
jgi:hypothetical protein